MHPPGPNGWLFDTNIVIHLARHSPTGAALLANYQLTTTPHWRYVCVVSRGEADSFVLYNNWGRRRRQKLDDELARLQHPLNISSPAVIDSYAHIDAASRAVGRRMGKNDLWIAAVARTYSLTLLTTDADFDHLGQTGWLDLVVQPVL